MECGDDKRRTSGCRAGRTTRWPYSESSDAVPFRSCSQEVPSRDISMMVFCNGDVYEARATIQIKGEGTDEWMAVAIHVLTTSVDLALKRG